MFVYRGHVRKKGVTKDNYVTKAMTKIALTEDPEFLTRYDLVEKKIRVMQLQIALYSFKELTTSSIGKVWQDVCEVDGKVFKDQICEILILCYPTEEERVYRLYIPSPFGVEHEELEYNLDLEDWHLNLLLPQVELEPKFRKKDGLQLRNNHPDNPNSRLLWRVPRPYYITDIKSEVYTCKR